MGHLSSWRGTGAAGGHWGCLWDTGAAAGALGLLEGTATAQTQAQSSAGGCLQAHGAVLSGLLAKNFKN